MKKLLIITLTAIVASLAEAQQSSDPRVADLVQAGKIRVGIHTFFSKDSRTGELRAVSSGIFFLDIARMLGARIGVEVVPVWHPTIPEMLTCVTAGQCDAGFMGPDPSRAGVDFSPPFVQLDYTFLVPAGSSIQRIADADQPNVRIAVVRDHDALDDRRGNRHGDRVHALADFLKKHPRSTSWTMPICSR